MRWHNFYRLALAVSVYLAVTPSAYAQCQYPPCSTTNPTMSLGSAPSGGYSHGAAIGIGVGAAAAVVGIVLYVHHKHSKENKATPFHASVVGCTRIAGDGMTLLDEKEKKVYSLVAAGMDLKSGELVELTGNETADSSGKRIFRVQTLTKHFGPCGTEAALNVAPAAQQ